MAGSSTGLQIAQVVVSGLTPVAVLGLGIFVSRAARRVEQVQSANKALIEQRLNVFREVSLLINKLYQFATFVGGWKEITPRQAVTVKRELDEKMYANRVLFSEDFFARYIEFTIALFSLYPATSTEVAIRAPVTIWRADRRELPWWDESMAALFSSEYELSPAVIAAAHDGLMRSFRAELYVPEQALPLLKPEGRPGSTSA